MEPFQRPSQLLQEAMPRVPYEERIRMISLHQEDVAQRKIAEITGRPLSTVNRILQAFKNEGRVHDEPHGSRPRCTLPQEDFHIVAAAVDKPLSTAQEIKNALGLNVDVQVIRRRLREAGLQSRTAARKPLLSDNHKNCRLQFATTHRDWTAEEWGNVMFTDESTFSTRGHERLKVWRPHGCR